MTDFQYLSELSEETQSSNSTTKIHTLPRSGVISMLDVEVRGTNGSTSNEGNLISQVVTRIEVLANGTEVLYSLTGQEAIRNAWLRFGQFPSALLTEDNDAVQFQHFPIMFGRFPGDKQYALDLSKFNSVDVRVTYNMGAVRAVSATTAFVTGTCVISILSLKASPPTGFSPSGMTVLREINTFTSAASGDTVVDLPLGRPILSVGVYAYESAIADDVDINRVQIRADRGNKILYDRQWNQGQRENAFMFHVDPTVHFHTVSQDADVLETWTGDLKTAYYTPVGAITVGTTDTVHAQWAAIDGGRLTWEAWTIEGTGTWAINAVLAADQDFKVTAAGIGVGNFLFAALDPKMDYSDPLDSSKFGNLDVVLTNGGAGATVGVLLEELRKY